MGEFEQFAPTCHIVRYTHSHLCRGREFKLQALIQSTPVIRGPQALYDFVLLSGRHAGADQMDEIVSIRRKE
ncbi:hypothetical protein A0U91_16380 (plasmid) [Acetobacter persici]|uniref:Uncharacterized protein n=1 Tax=Acetobacter persici TaxID=1076596 RepID=A0A1U9LJE5_9PROT|nr:hypothetical protein A0U91_16380 [Acetobacter persici]